jgi:hypothetical protein
MMGMPPWVVEFGRMLMFAGAIYGGIRADIANLTEGVREAKDSAQYAHKRIDTIILKGRNDG